MKTTLKYCLGFLVCVGMISFFCCSRNRQNTVTLAGSTAFQPFAEKLAEQYMAKNPGTNVRVQGGGSAVGVQSALSGTAAIGMADLLELPPEANVLTATEVANDGIAIIVNPQNTITGITAQQANDIFSGKISNWQDLGGPNATINVISREEGSGTRSSFDQLVLKGIPLLSSALFQNSNGTVREAVASDTSAIGYLSLSLVDQRVKAMEYDSAKPTLTMIKQKQYPLARPVYFLTNGEQTPSTKAFIDYVLSAEAQTTLEKEGLIGVSNNQ